MELYFVLIVLPYNDEEFFDVVASFFHFFVSYLRIL